MLRLQTQFILVTSNNYFKPTWAGNTCTLTKEEWMLNGRGQYQCFYFGQCLSRNNMRVWASPFALAYCGPVVLKCLSQDTLFPEVHFLLVLDFRWGVQMYWRCSEWWCWSSVARGANWCEWCIWSKCSQDVFPVEFPNKQIIQGSLSPYRWGT